jgi:hypothetical protein
MSRRSSISPHPGITFGPNTHGFVRGDGLPQLARDQEVIGVVQPDIAKYWQVTEEFSASSTGLRFLPRSMRRNKQEDPELADGQEG